MEILSFLLSLGGLGVSVYALIMAKNAKDAVVDALSKKDAQKDIADIQDILVFLNRAKEHAGIWVQGAVVETQIGRDHLSDLKVVREAEDALATWVPAKADNEFKRRLEKERNNLTQYCDKISNPLNNENHWNGIITSSQSLIRLLKEQNQKLGNSQIIN